MRNVPVRRAAVSGLALLFLLGICSVCFSAEQAITVNVTGLSLDGKMVVTKPDGTTETLKDTSKDIALPATIEMTAGKGGFWISLPTGFPGTFNTVIWGMRVGETVRVSLLKSNRGVRFEYLKGTSKLVVLVNNRENVLLVNAVTGTTSVVVSQNRVTIPEKSVAVLTCPMAISMSAVDQSRRWGDEKVIDVPQSAPAILYVAHRLSAADPHERATIAAGWPLSVTMNPGQVSELEFQYSEKDKDIQVVQILSQAGTVQVTRAGRTVSAVAGAPAIQQPIEIIPGAERLAIPVPAPETIEQSPYQPD